MHESSITQFVPSARLRRHLGLGGVAAVGKKVKPRKSHNTSFPCTESVFNAIDIAAAVVDSRANVVRKALVEYMNLTLLERRAEQPEVDVIQQLVRSGVGRVRSREVGISFSDVGVRARWDAVATEDGVVASNVLRRAVVRYLKLDSPEALLDAWGDVQAL